MITVGLVRELHFISVYASKKIECRIDVGEEINNLFVSVSQDGRLLVKYNNQDIWEEDISSQTSMFGIESCDSISRIISCINNGTDWSSHTWKEYLDIPQTKL